MHNAQTKSALDVVDGYADLGMSSEAWRELDALARQVEGGDPAEVARQRMLIQTYGLIATMGFPEDEDFAPLAPPPSPPEK